MSGLDLLRRMKQAPTDLVLRSVYADWLDDIGQPNESAFQRRLVSMVRFAERRVRARLCPATAVVRRYGVPNLYFGITDGKIRYRVFYLKGRSLEQQSSERSKWSVWAYAWVYHGSGAVCSKGYGSESREEQARFFLMQSTETQWDSHCRSTGVY